MAINGKVWCPTENVALKPGAICWVKPPSDWIEISCNKPFKMVVPTYGLQGGEQVEIIRTDKDQPLLLYVHVDVYQATRSHRGTVYSLPPGVVKFWIHRANVTTNKAEAMLWRLR